MLPNIFGSNTRHVSIRKKIQRYYTIVTISMDLEVKTLAQTESFCLATPCDRLNTRDMLECRHLNIGHNFSCLLCNSGEEETLEHLSLTCSSLKLLLHGEFGKRETTEVFGIECLEKYIFVCRDGVNYRKFGNK